MLAEQGGAASLLTQDTRAEYSQGMAEFAFNAAEHSTPSTPTQVSRDEYDENMAGSEPPSTPTQGSVAELSLPSSVPSVNLLDPSQPTQDNRAGYGQSLGIPEPSVSFGSGVNTDVSFFAGSQVKPSQPTISEEDLEIERMAERIKSQMKSDEMSSSAGCQDGL